MRVNLDTVTVLHNEKLHRFEAYVDGLTSLLTYVRSADRITLMHTEVPSELEGNGIAGKLTQTALDFARANRLRVVPRCPYVAHYVRQHPESQDLLAADDLQLLLSQK
jgi:predicted GNAT family acetyltransferase